MYLQEEDLVKGTIEFPVRYDHQQQTIRDSKGMMICDIRGWGRIQYMEKSEARQDAIGTKIARLLNESEADQSRSNCNSVYESKSSRYK